MTAITTPVPAYPRRKDPILQDLWDTKAMLNKEAGYDVSTLFANARKTAEMLEARGLWTGRRAPLVSDGVAANNPPALRVDPPTSQEGTGEALFAPAK